MKVVSIQISPVFLRKQETWEKLKNYIIKASEHGAKLATWGETLLPGYPAWISPSGGASFNNADQKRAYQTYVEQALTLDDPIINEMRELAKEYDIYLMGGITERNSGSTYATLLTISNKGKILGRHRKIKPTYEERLVWADGDATGLKVYETELGKIGGLNCWENWLPLARTALHNQGEMVHIAVWPGSIKLTRDISRFIAMEGRSWVISTSGLLHSDDFKHLSVEEFPLKQIMEGKNGYWQNGGSMIVNPRGEMVAGPLVEEEGILYADIDLGLVLQERQNLDISGHYSRSDIFNFSVNQ